LARDNIICGLDIGSSNIRAVVAQIRAGQEKPQILGTGVAPSAGLRRGVVVDIEETVKGIKRALEEAERASSIAVDAAIINIGGNHISCRSSKGVVAVSRADGEISAEDAERAVKAAEAVSIPQNREIIHTIPRYFNVDEEKFIKDPVGMTGVRLEADALLIEGSSPFVKNLNKCLHEAEIGIEEMVLSTLAAAKAVLSKRQKELGVLVLDIGGGTTGMTVFEEGDIMHTCVLPIGGSHITNDLAIGLRTSVDVAERVKLEYGTALTEEISKKDMIDLTKMEGEEGVVPRKYVAEIIHARLNEIFDLVNRELKKIDRQGLLPAGLVLVGGGAKMPGMVDLAKSELHLPTQIGFPIGVDGVLNRIDDPAFATSVGLMLWGAGDQMKNMSHKKSYASAKSGLSKVQKWIKTFLP
jgi:cell division protein FtsA